MDIYIYLFFVVLAFSISVILEKKTLKYIGPKTAIVAKGVLYFLFGIVLLFILKLRNITIVDYKKNKNFKKGLLYIAIAYILIFLVGNLLYYTVLDKTDRITELTFMFIVINTITILLLTYFIRGERINLKTFLGILIALFGVSITLLN